MAAIPPGCYPRIAVLLCCHLKGSSWNGPLYGMEWSGVILESGAVLEWSGSGVFTYGVCSLISFWFDIVLV